MKTYIKEAACTIQKFETEQIYFRAGAYSEHKRYTKIQNNSKTTWGFIVKQCISQYLFT